LDYAIGFINEVASTVRQGKAEGKDELHVEFQGPDATNPSPLHPGRGIKVLGRFEGTVGESADRQRLPLMQRPDMNILRTAYADDPVVQKLLDWVEVRYAK
jgi:hypothetical protein